MNQKIISLLKLILSNDGKIEFDRACEELSFTKRMMLYHLKKLNSYLVAAHLPETCLVDGIILLHYQDKKQFTGFVANTPECDYILSPMERQALILLRIGLSSAPITIDALGELINASRSTVLNTIGEIKMLLKKFYIELEHRPKQGYYLLGDEMKIRQQISTAYFNVSNLVTESIRMQIVLNEASLRSGRHLQSTVFNQLHDVICASEKHMGKCFNYFSIDEISHTLILIYLRSFHGVVSISNQAISDKSAVLAATKVLKLMQEMGLPIPKTELNYVAILLMGTKIYSSEDQIPDPQADMFSQDLLNEFEQLSQIKFPEHTALMDMFRLHIRPMFYRMKYCIKVTNYNSNDIQKTHTNFYRLTELAAQSVGKKYGFECPPDEVAYLCLYFSCINRINSQKDEDENVDILIVCGAGVGLSVFIKQQLQALLGGGYRYSLCDARALNSYDLSPYALVVSAVDLQPSDNMGSIPSVQVDSFITPSQRKEILNWSLKNNYPYGAAQKINALLDIIDRHTSVTNREKLICDLNCYFQPNNFPTNELHFQDVFRLQYIGLCREETTWQQGLIIACEPLVQCGCIDRAYAINIIELIEERGPYAECQPSILLAHAKPCKAVHKVAIGVTIFHHPLQFKPWGKAMKVVFVLAAVDHETHSTALGELITHLANPQVQAELQSFSSGEIIDIYKLLSLSDK